jgi:hypothetical protein
MNYEGTTAFRETTTGRRTHLRGERTQPRDAFKHSAGVAAWPQLLPSIPRPIYIIIFCTANRKWNIH